MKRWRNILLPIALFLITFFSTLIAGALQKGINPIQDPQGILEGLPFAIALLGILLTHELSHYVTSRKYGVETTLPFFIPAPSLIGTFGAFIKMKSPILSKRALVDIGASGPIAGFLMALLISIAGLHFSKVVSVSKMPGSLSLGDSILFSILSRVVLGKIAAGYDILLHPIAFAGWIGFFITSLNLIPVGQLDGGHIAFALLGKKHKFFSLFLIALLLILGSVYWLGWLIWAVLLLILGVKHPPVVYGEIPLDQSRRLLGLACFLIFILTFTPVPFKIDF